MEDNSNRKLIDQNNLYGTTSLIIGIGLMVFMGALMYEGLEILNPQDEGSIPNIYTVIICQAVESLAWVMIFSARLLPRILRYGMLAAGVASFVFSISLVTAAQKTMNLNTDLSNSNVKEQRDIVKDQLKINVAEQNVVVNTAHNNSDSVHTVNRDKAREVGQDLAEPKKELDENRKELEKLNNKITITALDIFKWSEELTGMSARDLEAGWLVFRSFFFESCAILFLAAGSALLSRRQNPEQSQPDKTVGNTKINDMTKKPILKVFSNQTKGSTRSKPKHRAPDAQLFILANRLFEENAIKLNRTSIIYGLKHHHGIGIGSARAGRILEYLRSEHGDAQIKLEVNR